MIGPGRNLSVKTAPADWPREEVCSMEIGLTVSGPLLATLDHHCEIRGKDHCDLLASILVAVLREDLVNAILDDEE